MPSSQRGRRLLAILTLSALGLTACAPGPSVDPTPVAQVDAQLPGDMREELQTAVETAMAATGSTGAIVEVRAPWAGTWTQAFGTTKPDGPAVRDDMKFRVGPVARTMTCDILHGMAHRGIVSTDDEVGRWLSGFPSVASITLGQLCDGTSGLGTYAGEISRRWYANPPRIWSPKELISYGIAQGIAGEPGTTYRDSDTAYLLLALALERASHTPVTDLLAEYVFDPLGMDATSLPRSVSDPSSWLGALRSGNSKGKPNCAAPLDLTELSPSTAYTAGGIVSTVDDLSDYIQSVAVGARSFDGDERFDAPLPVSDDSPSWFTATGGAFQAGSLVGSSGAVPGYLTAAYADRETGLSVVLVLNNSRAGGTMPRSLAWQLAAIASKAPAAEGQSRPEAGGLPWEAATYGDQIVEDALCPLP